jgi:hypothetical protein
MNSKGKPIFFAQKIKIIDLLSLIRTFQKELYHFIKKGGKKVKKQ